MCRTARDPRSSFYAGAATSLQRPRPDAGPSASTSDGCSTRGGAPTAGRRVAAQLNREGHPCSVGLVADLMRELGPRACQPRAPLSAVRGHRSALQRPWPRGHHRRTGRAAQLRPPEGPSTEMRGGRSGRPVVGSCPESERRGRSVFMSSTTWFRRRRLRTTALYSRGSRRWPPARGPSGPGREPRVRRRRDGDDRRGPLVAVSASRTRLWSAVVGTLPTIAHR